MTSWWGRWSDGALGVQVVRDVARWWERRPDGERIGQVVREVARKVEGRGTWERWRYVCVGGWGLVGTCPLLLMRRSSSGVTTSCPCPATPLSCTSLPCPSHLALSSSVIPFRLLSSSALADTALYLISIYPVSISKAVLFLVNFSSQSFPSHPISLHFLNLFLSIEKMRIK